MNKAKERQEFIVFVAVIFALMVGYALGVWSAMQPLPN